MLVIPRQKDSLMKRSALALLALSALALTGCSGAEAEPEPTAPNVEVPTSDGAESEEQDLSSRGNLVLEPGDPVVVTGYEDDDLEGATFVVKSVEVDPVCTDPYVQESENGHFVVLEVEVETAKEPDFTEATFGSFYVGSGAFKVIDKNGTTVNEVMGTGYSCFDQAEQLPGNLGAGERATGKVVLDVPSAEGVIVYNNFVAPGRPSYEWHFPTKTVGA